MTQPADLQSDRHVAVLLPTLAAGGVARVYVDLANGFAERGFRVDLVLHSARGPHLARVGPAVRIVELERHSRLSARTRILSAHDGPLRELLRPVLLSLSDPRAYRGLASLVHYLERERPEVLLTAKTHSNLAALWARELAGTSTRVVVSERTNLSLQMARKPQWRWRHIAPLVARLYPRADAIIAVSDGVSDDLSSIAGIERGRIQTVYNPIDADRIQELAREPASHPWLGEQQPFVLGVGRLVPQKDFLLLLEAFAKLAAQRSDLRLVILGEGDERPRIQARARDLGLEERVDLPGYQSNPYPYMARAGAFALSSAWEGLPGALLEALCCDCPVVATDCPSGPREILEGGSIGELVPVGDAASLSKALARVLDHPPAPGTLRKRGEMFGAAAAIEGYLRVLFEADLPSA